ncbi:MAG TPA: ParA family protein [Leptospiraceae bacterium]|nr:ParA family protein [Leptospiraceae bacterium]HMY65004.1 ParA family protein [Leptospiraceae bacterium]HNF12214.1 ParA family protein [Leptospiraceae bacterium]HNF22875.1 ParA family protein [Leptospiraceae bacterium]HNH07815.1 ParA family protein [Leptospiraceae bacterium]
MAKIYSLVNLKGGVGKTTLAVNIAAGLANFPRPEGIPFNVLLIDADPQSNASIYMLGEEYWRKEIYSKLVNSPNLYRLLDTMVNGGGIFSYDDFIIKERTDAPNPIFNRMQYRRSDGKEEFREAKMTWPNLHLLAAIPKLNEISEDLVSIHTLNRRFEKYGQLKKITSAFENEYDYIIIDCPPNFSPLTKNAIAASHNLIIPYIPDYMSTVGLNELLANISENQERQDLSVQAFIPTLYNDMSKDYRKFIEQVNEDIMEKIRKQNPSAANILNRKNTGLFYTGLKRSVSVSSAIESHRPIIDLSISSDSRKEIDLIVDFIIDPQRMRRGSRNEQQ